MRSLLALLGLALLCTVRPAVADEPAAAVLDEVLVTGEQPGPGMWRVTKDDHELWILATLDPLPKKMQWRSKQVEDVIARAQAVLAPPDVQVDVGFFRGLTLLPSLLRARKNEDGDKLVDVLPPDLYARWSVLKQKFLGSGNGVEKFRPMVAAVELYQKAMDKSGLTNPRFVWDLVKKTARQNKVEIVSTSVRMKLEDPKDKIRQFQQTPREAEIACLRTTLERLETDLGPMRQRATLWAQGDLEGIRALPFADERAACFDAIMQVPQLKELADSLRAQVQDTWVGAAQAALRDHRTSFAVLTLGEATKPDGMLARLRSLGYAVEDPE